MGIELLSFLAAGFAAGFYIGTRVGWSYFLARIDRRGQLIVAIDEWDRLRQAERALRERIANVRGVP